MVNLPFTLHLHGNSPEKIFLRFTLILDPHDHSIVTTKWRLFSSSKNKIAAAANTNQKMAGNSNQENGENVESLSPSRPISEKSKQM